MRKKDELTEMQAKYVDFYMGEAKGVGKEAFRLARGGKAGSSNQVYTMHHNVKVQEALKARKELRKAASWIAEDDVLKGLYEEATNFDSGTAMSRISAWVWIGKHIGMWKEKKEDEEKGPPSIQVVSYGGVVVKQEEKVVNEEVVVEKAPIPSNVRLVNFQEAK